MKIKPLLSIIITVFNRVDLFESTFNSIDLDNDIEVIIVDDGSNEVASAELDKFSRENVRVIHQSNQGPGAARNTGIDNSNGKYIFFLDSDDVLTSEMNNFIKKNLINSNEKIMRFYIRKLSNNRLIKFSPSFNRVSKIGSYNICQVSSFLFESTIINKIKFRGIFAEDKTFQAEIYTKYGFNSILYKFPSIIYRDTNENSIMRAGISKRQINDFVEESKKDLSINQKFVAWMVSKDNKCPDILNILGIRRRDIFLVAPIYFKFLILFSFR